jgi:tetratricopeptide (TPR) repeat protein
MAQSHFEQGLARPIKNLADKLADYTEAIRLNPLNANAYYRRGVVYQYKSEYEKALADYDEAIQLDPQFQDAYLARATARNDQGDTDGMFADLGMAIQVNPLHSKPYLERSAVYYDSGNYGSALTDLSKAIQIAPTAGTYSNRAECYFALGQYKEAFADFQKAQSLEENSPYAVAGMAITLHAQGKSEEARQQWRTLANLGLNYLDADRVGKELNWAQSLINEAQKLVAEL